MAAAIPEAMARMRGAMVMTDALEGSAVIRGMMASKHRGRHAALTLQINLPVFAV
jgi:hypothetical protein